MVPQAIPTAEYRSTIGSVHHSNRFDQAKGFK
jgi:hypothetical protein